MIDKNRLVNQAADYGIDASHCADKLARYAEILVEYNKKVNLTAITDAEGIEQKHFLDCLLFADLPQVNGSLVDVGTGAGFPGVVAKLYKPQLQLTLMEPTGKRIDFLKYLCAELSIKAEFAKERAEEAARKKWRESFDAASARAVAAMNVLSEYCLPLVKPGGYFIAMKADVTAELEAAVPAIEKLGGKYIETKHFTLPNENSRSIVICKKISQTPSVYPRNGGKISKSPLK